MKIFKHSSLQVRNAIQSAAKERLHTLTSSIEHKITEFAKRHPDSVKQAKLATSLLPKIPMSDEKLAEQKREISRYLKSFEIRILENILSYCYRLGSIPIKVGTIYNGEYPPGVFFAERTKIFRPLFYRVYIF